MDTQKALDSLEKDGIALLGKIISDDDLASMQAVYTRALEKPSWNTWIGFEQNEKWRRLIENLLLYDKAFLDLAVRDDVISVLDQYIGEGYELTEARGWETVATRRDFHGWHQDAWCSEDLVPRPREVKLACYLTDVTSGHFQYMRGTHGSNEPARMFPDRELVGMSDKIIDAKGEAGTCFLFDTSGIHRQSVPVLKKRWVIMYNYHDPTTPMGDFATGYGRYRPHMLNAGFLGGLSANQQRILGFHRKRPESGFHPEERRYPATHNLVGLITRLRLEYQDFSGQVDRVISAIQRRLPGSR